MRPCWNPNKIALKSLKMREKPDFWEILIFGMKFSDISVCLLSCFYFHMEINGKGLSYITDGFATGTRSIKTWQVHWRIEGEELQSRERDRVHFFHAVFITSPSALMPLVLLAWKPRLTWKCIFVFTPTREGQFSNFSISRWIFLFKINNCCQPKKMRLPWKQASRRFYSTPQNLCG